MFKPGLFENTMAYQMMVTGEAATSSQYVHTCQLPGPLDFAFLQLLRLRDVNHPNGLLRRLQEVQSTDESFSSCVRQRVPKRGKSVLHR